jgi:DNA topoisomerase I
VVDAYLDGNLLLEVQKDIDKQLSEDIESLRAEEAAVLSFLRARIEGLTGAEIVEAVSGGPAQHKGQQSLGQKKGISPRTGQAA